MGEGGWVSFTVNKDNTANRKTSKDMLKFEEAEKRGRGEAMGAGIGTRPEYRRRKKRQQVEGVGREGHREGYIDKTSTYIFIPIRTGRGREREKVK